MNFTTGNNRSQAESLLTHSAYTINGYNEWKIILLSECGIVSFGVCDDSLRYILLSNGMIVTNDTYKATEIVLRKSDYVMFNYELNGDVHSYQTKDYSGIIPIPKKTLRPCVLFNNPKDMIMLEY
jgi:hypothetical protein